MGKIFFCILKVTEESDPELDPDPDPDPFVRVRIRGSGSAPKCIGSPTLRQTSSAPNPNYIQTIGR
jgi:hypothetical protein